MKPLLPLVVITAIAFAGCATPFRAPADVAHLKLERTDSPTIIVEKIWLERKKGPLVVTGYVIKRLEAVDTTGTHLDVTLYDAAGRVLRRTVEYFEPRQLIRRFRRYPYGTYRVGLDPLPPATTRIEVKAHDGPADAH